MFQGFYTSNLLVKVEKKNNKSDGEKIKKFSMRVIFLSQWIEVYFRSSTEIKKAENNSGAIRSKRSHS